MNIFDNLNERQKEAVSHINGPILVVAGAGSGKTKVLTHRIANLIDNGVHPMNILGVTFTNKAAGEMQERIDRLLGEQFYAKPLIGTFHSIGVRILRQDMEALNRKTSFTIMDSDDTKALVRQICKDLELPSDLVHPKAVQNRISQAKNSMLTADEFSLNIASEFDRKVSDVFTVYERQLVQMNAVDFDDLLILPVRIFQNYAQILEKYQKRWQYLLIDEFQDTNPVQYLFASLLSDKHQNICAIGDSDQAIYSFRGATIQNILDFNKNFPEAKVVKLEQNYRSTSNILSAADSVIENNSSRVPKKMFTENGEGDLVNIFEFKDGREEAEAIMREIGDLRVLDNRNYSDFAILYRTNAQSRQFEEAALKYGIPYQIVGGVKFYSRKEIKDILAYLRIIANEDDTVSLLRIINVPPRKIGKVSLQRLEAFAQSKSMELFAVLRHVELAEGITPSAKTALSEFSKKTNELKKEKNTTSVADLIMEVIKKFEIEQYLRDGTEEGEVRWENVRELVSVARKFDGVENSLDLFLEEVALIADMDSLDEKQDRIVLMTLHNAKGLEFPVVFIGGMEENLFPHANSMFSPEDIEEERRIMYVGMTRAREKLYLTYADSRMIFGDITFNRPSRFLDEIKADYVNQPQKKEQGFSEGVSMTPMYDDFPEYVAEFFTGDNVSHPVFGEGVISQVQGDILTVNFKKAGTKRLAASVAPLKKLGSAEYFD